MRLSPETKVEDVVVGTHRRANILTCIPTLTGMVPIEFVVAFGRLQMPIGGLMESSIIKGMKIDQARNYFVEYVLSRPKDNRPEYLFFLGDDMLPPWDGLVKLYHEMMEGDWDCLTGLYYWKGEPPRALAWRDGVVGGLVPGEHFQIGEIVSVDITGMDFTLLKVSTLEKIKPPWFQTGPSKKEGEEGIALYTEDVFFCRKLAAMGGKVAVHSGVRVAHLDIKTGIIY